MFGTQILKDLCMFLLYNLCKIFITYIASSKITILLKMLPHDTTKDASGSVPVCDFNLTAGIPAENVQKLNAKITNTKLQKRNCTQTLNTGREVK